MRCTDAEGDWLVNIGPDGDRQPRSQRCRRGAADCLVAGRADDLYLALWNRAGAQDLTVEGGTRRVGPVLRGGAVR